MTVPPAFLLMENNDARLACQASAFFDETQCRLEGFDGRILARGRIERNREQVLFALRAEGSFLN